ncbi:PREDICTED: trypsin CFT-1-like [Papilio xuthus]|uniref:trypsin n=1 Tax=Papilio xuthus TaxID=66420 RepID=A0AAJ7EFW0_PAPXU|nr:PREDICTED: trypsin CFT-1-like [Papilio xuthus]
MRISLLLLALGLAVATGAPKNSERIVGGSITTISEYPYGAALLFSSVVTTFWQVCGGTILNNRAILSAAHCFYYTSAINWRIRVGSSYGNSGGDVHLTSQIIMHPEYNDFTYVNDIAILRASTNFAFNNDVQPGSIAGPNYNLIDNQVVWAIGWGATTFKGPRSEQLRHVQVWTVNQATCRQRYAERREVTGNMLCSGWLDVGGRDQCQGDSGGPLIHNNVVVGVCSWGYECARAEYPGVNTRVSSYTPWIQANA